MASKGKRWNPVAKNAPKFNRSVRMDPKKLKQKRGHVKHKGQYDVD